ncbi:transporter associated domain-containing protein [Deinococcus hohokamensis]|uniref:Transporter associated domain-containing protein n=1 Tax=Deinococcus hohokamensis TaxID=309883 RepID=A0ABV9I9Z8_9DEIO
MLQVCGGLPQVGTQLEVGGWTLEVLDLDGPRVDRLLITPPPGVVIRRVDED